MNDFRKIEEYIKIINKGVIAKNLELTRLTRKLDETTIENERLIRINAETIKLLNECRQELENHMCYSIDGEGYNDDDVIELCNKLDKYFQSNATSKPKKLSLDAAVEQRLFGEYKRTDNE